MIEAIETILMMTTPSDHELPQNKKNGKNGWSLSLAKKDFTRKNQKVISGKLFMGL